ncbi:hypothetical protein EVAR_79196_1 [Eumeta japonica]|uniref:Uncharacterized protein n=1 Tax=Eumeta variegata TaxID=151549 RepID=A0A4C1UUE7_EUMVA|nr:hypothetical protein EVAR_79196_1 [Eumeta japonica]
MRVVSTQFATASPILAFTVPLKMRSALVKDVINSRPELKSIEAVRSETYSIAYPRCATSLATRRRRTQSCTKTSAVRPIIVGAARHVFIDTVVVSNKSLGPLTCSMALAVCKVCVTVSDGARASFKYHRVNLIDMKADSSVLLSKWTNCPGYHGIVLDYHGWMVGGGGFRLVVRRLRPEDLDTVFPRCDVMLK